VRDEGYGGIESVGAAQHVAEGIMGRAQLSRRDQAGHGPILAR
jgi:hypothetical protein